MDGAKFTKAQHDKERMYHDVSDSPHAELIVLAAEMGGRWNDTALTLVKLLAKHKVQDVPLVLRRSAELAWTDRWWTLLGVAVQDALAASVLAPSTLDASDSYDLEPDRLLDDERL